MYELLEYTNLLPQQAENARAMFKSHPLIKTLLGVSPTAEIKYKNLKQAPTLALQKFGHELLSKHWKPAASAASKTVAETAMKAKSHGNAGGPETKIHIESLSIGGGKAQSYIQHMPNGPEGGKRLIVAVTVTQAKN